MESRGMRQENFRELEELEVLDEQAKDNEMELGNMLFGHSRGEYPFPDRNLVDSPEWRSLCKKAGVDPLYGYSLTKKEYNGYENDVFEIRPYYWGDDPDIADLPNFHYKPNNLQIRWYKYAFRDAYTNILVTIPQLLEVFRKCEKSIR